MQKSCQIEDHDLPISFICCNPACLNLRVLCLQCLDSFHKNCNSHLLDINQISSRNFNKNRNWLSNNKLKTTALMIEKNKLPGVADQLIASFQDNIDKEHNKLIAYFTQKLNEVKERAIKKCKDSYYKAQQQAEEFTNRLKNLYNFDSLLGIIETWQREDKEIKVLSGELESFFKQIESNEQQMNSLKALANELNSFNKDYVQFNIKSYQDFQISLENLLANSSLIGKIDWKWDANKKSFVLNLSENNTIVTKTSGEKLSAVTGNILMSQGVYKWEIEVQSHSHDKRSVSFGIVQNNLAINLEEFPCDKTICLGANGYTTMKLVNSLKSYDNKTYLCYLDLNEGTFTISHQGTVICKTKKNLEEGEVFVPFVGLRYSHNFAKLRVIE